MKNFQALLDSLPARWEETGAAGVRQLLVVSGEARWCREQTEAILSAWPQQRGIWLGGTETGVLQAVSFSAVRRWLGRETDLIVIDSHQGFDADAIAAISGTLQAGGLLVWLMPELAELGGVADPQWSRLLSEGDQPFASSPFLQRLAALIIAAPELYLYQQNKPLPAWIPVPRPKPAAIPVHPPYRSKDQQRAVEAIMHVVQGHRRRPLVLSADQGRGKSTAFGLAAARLLQEGKQRILVVAPAWTAVETLFRKAAAQLREARLEPGCLFYGAGMMQFQVPDTLDGEPADLVLVDEAAALPVALLERLLARYSRIAFATTVHGYEGTGRGFAVRFRPLLDRLAPGWRERRLGTPIRWAADDPVERFMFEAFLLDAEPAVLDDPEPLVPTDCRFELLQSSRLLKDEALLRQVFGLLVQAHYRTRPFDLRLLLDAPGIRLTVAWQADRIVAVCLAMQEGGLDTAPADDIYAGRRWLRGHLLAQLLLMQTGNVEALVQRGLRVLRLAVHPRLQRRGIGSALVDHLRERCRMAGLDWWGVSFGANPGLLDFWQRWAMRPVQLAQRADGRSGEFSLAMAQALSSVAEPLVDQAGERLAQQWLPGLSRAWSGLDAGLVGSLTARMTSIWPGMEERDRRELEAFARGRRRFEDSEVALQRWLLQQLQTSRCQDSYRERFALLIPLLLQRHSLRQVARQKGFSGPRPLLDELRRGIVSALATDAGNSQ